MSTSARGTTDFSELDDDSTPLGRAVFWGLVLLGVGSLLLFVAWLMGWVRLFSDPRLAEIKKLQADAQKQFTANGGPQNLEEAKAAVASMQQIREKMEKLPESLRREAGRDSGAMFRGAMRTRINAYFALPPEQRQAELDRQIKQEELMRQAFMESRPMGGRPGGGAGGGPGGPDRGPGGRGNGERGAGGRGPGGGPDGGNGGSFAGGPGGPGGGPGGPPGGGPPGGGPPGGGPPGGPGGGPPGGPGGGPGGPGGGPGGPRGNTEEDRNRWRKNIIDSTTPEQRAQYTEYRRAMEARREQLGQSRGQR